MNRLRTELTGGMPDFQDSFRWTEEAVKEALAMICRGVGGGEPALILWGCLVANNATHRMVGEGAIFLDGEVFYVPAHQVPVQSGGFWYWVPEVTDDPAGLVQFQDGVMRDTYEVRRAKLEWTTVEDLTKVGEGVTTLTEVLTPKTTHDALATALGALQGAVAGHLATDGNAYYRAVVPDPITTHGQIDVVWAVKTGALVGAADLRLDPGGVYRVSVLKGGAAGLVLVYGAITVPLTGETIIEHGNDPEIDAKFQYTTDMEIEVHVQLVGSHFPTA